MNKNKANLIYLIGFFFALNTAIPAYVSSSFLNQFAPEKVVGIFYTVASLLTLILLLLMPGILRKIGNYKTTLFLLSLHFVALLVIAFSPSVISIAIMFVLSLASINLLYFNFDVFLEHISLNEITGKIRGLYLTSGNTAWVISPLFVSFLLTNGDYWKIFFVSALLIIPVIFLLEKNLKKFKDPDYEKSDFWETLKILKRRKNVREILVSNFLLRFFYSWMVIYTPIYLHEYIGFSWATLGIIFTIMLLPFVLLEFPLGNMADKKFGEKEILNIGFIITAIITASLSFITSTNFVIWALLLFGTRVGASMIEISIESYFFKKINSDDTNILSFFRMTRPIAYIFGPLTASLLLFFVDFNYLFVILGGILLFFGLTHGLRIKDTR
ncbi:MFS transporter [Patescibacteria group bacterium]|nr:MFS transporter [Patescibacteria group bacterium]MCG2694977.1 MFS transporter [Candidatus Parcubacteria bacterium]